MSHSHGAVRFELDGLILHCEYNDTVDVMLPKLFDTIEEVSEHWRQPYDWTTCNCGRSEKVRIISTYGGGFSWDGMACRYCKIITDFHEPNYNTETDGLPDWYPNKKEIDEYFK